MSTLDFAEKFLFGPLGIKEVYWEKDSKGFNFGGGNLFMSQYDLAKIGYLILNNGAWDDKVIVSKHWIEQSLKSHNEWIYGFHYGYLWYLKNEKDEITGKEYAAYSASGAGGQKIYVIPDLDIYLLVLLSLYIKSQFVSMWLVLFPSDHTLHGTDTLRKSAGNMFFMLL